MKRKRHLPFLHQIVMLLTLTGYELHKISLDAHVKAPTLLVLSEIYFPSGWESICRWSGNRNFLKQIISSDLYFYSPEIIK